MLDSRFKRFIVICTAKHTGYTERWNSHFAIKEYFIQNKYPKLFLLWDWNLFLNPQASFVHFGHFSFAPYVFNIVCTLLALSSQKCTCLDARSSEVESDVEFFSTSVGVSDPSSAHPTTEWTAKNRQIWFPSHAEMQRHIQAPAGMIPGPSSYAKSRIHVASSLTFSVTADMIQLCSSEAAANYSSACPTSQPSTGWKSGSLQMMPGHMPGGVRYILEKLLVEIQCHFQISCIMSGVTKGSKEDATSWILHSKVPSQIQLVSCLKKKW